MATAAHGAEAHETRTASHDWVNDHYTYTYNKNVATPFLKHLNDKHKPSKEWNSKLAEFANNAVSKVLAAAQEDHIWIVKKFASLIGVIKDDFLAFVHEEKIRADHLMDYVITFLDTPATAPVDEPKKETVIISTDHLNDSKTAVTDAFFSEYRVSGPNPIAIQLCTAQILEKLKLQDSPEMTALLEKNKLFAVDYSNFADQPPGEPSLIFSSPPKYTYGSIALFKEVEASIAGDPNYHWTHLTPVCIQISGNKRAATIFCPKANDDSDVKWKIAKCVFQSNDGVYHEAFSHLGGTHLVAEIFMVATYRRIPEGHPLFVLLDKHFEGTAFINSVAVDELISDGGAVDLLVTPAITSVQKLVADYVAEFTSHDMTFPARIKARQMDKETVPHLNYPYRDDGLLLWDAILKWTNGYLHVYYKSHQQVLDDKYVEAWLKELTSDHGGKVKWIESLTFDNTNARDQLATLLATIIFIGSVDHAAVNFPQRTIMQFTGAFPLAIHASEDLVFNEDPTEDDYMSLYPTIKIARVQAQVTQLLGGIRYTKLGHYHTIDDQEHIGMYFVAHVGKKYGDSHEVRAVLQSFRDDLDKITEEIERRNTFRTYKYVELLPSGIPQSINI